MGPIDFDSDFAFGDFRVSVGARIVSYKGRSLDLSPKPFELLMFLVENRSRVVSREELVRDVWCAEHVSPEAVRFAVHSLRRSLRAAGDDREWIRTIPRAGYQFVGDVESSLGEFISREGVLRAFSLALSTASYGEGRLLLLAGEPGSGRSTTLSQFADRATAAAFVVSAERCDEEALSIVGGASEVGPAPRDRDVGDWGVPRSRSGVGPHATVSSEAWVQRVRQRCRDKPHALLLDDIEALPGHRFQYLVHLLERISDVPIVVCATACSVSAGTLSARSKDLLAAAGDSSASLVRLPRFGGRETQRFLRARFGLRISTDSAAHLAQRTAGSPLFLYEAIKDHLRSSSGNDVEKLVRQAPIAATLEGHYRRRLDGCPKHVRDVLVAASVIGETFDLALLRSMVESTADVDGAIWHAQEAGVVMADLSPRFRFANSTLRKAVYRSAPLATRQALHRGLAIEMQARCGAIPGPFSERIAEHHRDAGGERDLETSIDHFVRASEWAVSCRDLPAALDCLRRAQAVLDGSFLGCDEIRSEILIRLGRLSRTMGRRKESEAFLDAAIVFARRCSRPDLLAEAALESSADLLAIETGVFDPSLVALLEEAVSSLVPLRAHHDHRARLYARLAVALHWSEDRFREIPGLLSQARREAAKAGKEARCYVRSASRMASFDLGSPQTRIASTGICLSDRVLEITGLLQTGEVSSAEYAIDAFEKTVAGAGADSAAWYVPMFRGCVSLLRGDFGFASEMRQALLDLGTSVGDVNASHSFALQSAMASLDTGDLQKSTGSVRIMSDSFPRVDGWRAGFCYLLHEIGRKAEATLLWKSCNDAALLDRPRRNAWFGTACAMSLTVGAYGSVVDARAIFGRFVRFSGQLCVVGFGSYCWGSSDRFIATAAFAAGEPDVAARHYRAAIAINTRVGALPALAYSHFGLASTLCARRQGEPLRDLDTAEELAAACGMVPLLASIDELRERL